jgi:hypothetical protein
VLLADVEFDWDDGQKRPWTAWLTEILNTAREGWNDQPIARRVQLCAACLITAATAADCDTTAVRCDT